MALSQENMFLVSAVLEIVISFGLKLRWPKKLKILKFTESTETMLLVSVVHKMSALDLKCGHRN